MSNYTKLTAYDTKDALSTGDPLKRIKGTELDDEFDAIAVAIATKANSASPTFTGTPVAPTAAVGTNTTQLATTAFVLANGVPVGSILMWSGTIASIPSGWYLCDGTNSTPDLRNKFIVGAYLDDSGAKTTITGSNTQTGGSKDAVNVSHSHTTDSQGSGTFYAANRTGGSPTGVLSYTGTTANSLLSGGGLTDDIKQYSVAAHTHTVSTEGVSGTNQNLPPYYALAFIMKG
jgi:hypothetical protein